MGIRACICSSRRSLVLIFLSAVLPFFALSQDQGRKFNVAVLDFVTRGGLSPDEALTLSDNFQSLLVSAGNFVVVDRERIKEILKEQSLQSSGVCSDKQCLVEIGKILKVEKMFSGSIGRVGKTYSINIQVIDVTTAEIQTTESRQYAGEVDDLLSIVIPDMTQKIVQRLTGVKVAVSSSSSGGSSWLWYAGGAAVLGGGAAAVILAGSKKSNPTQNPTGTSGLPGFTGWPPP